MIDQARIAADRMVSSQLIARGVRDPAILDAMREVPRHLFVPEVSIERAYSDRALPLTAGQTISQPYIVAHMTELLDVHKSMSVLEIGTGSGYQTAILIRLVARVVTIERSAELLDRARTVLAKVYQQIGDRSTEPLEPRVDWESGSQLAPMRMLLADGTLGYPPEAPYDRILVTAAAPCVPDAYRQQLANQGRLVIPLGDRDNQTLTVIDRQGNDFTETDDIACRFVPLVGEDGWKV
jgi:protein-L-isoaspartate(D-aspartate) O-methyltransferase